MDITKTAQETARTIRESIKPGEIPAVAQTDRDGEDLIPTNDEIWKEIEDRWVKIIVRELEVAYEAGKQVNKM